MVPLFESWSVGFLGRFVAPLQALPVLRHVGFLTSYLEMRLYVNNPACLANPGYVPYADRNDDLESHEVFSGSLIMYLRVI